MQTLSVWGLDAQNGAKTTRHERLFKQLLYVEKPACSDLRNWVEAIKAIFLTGMDKSVPNVIPLIFLDATGCLGPVSVDLEIIIVRTRYVFVNSFIWTAGKGENHEFV
jgi:hypothetical protein